jgi:hypothetical protein
MMNLDTNQTTSASPVTFQVQKKSKLERMLKAAAEALSTSETSIVEALVKAVATGAADDVLAGNLESGATADKRSITCYPSAELVDKAADSIRRNGGGQRSRQRALELALTAFCEANDLV